MNTRELLKFVSVYLALTAIVLNGGLAFGYSNGETHSEIDEAETQIAMVRMFLETLKLNVTAEEGTFSLDRYPEGGERFSEERRHAVASRAAGSISIDGDALTTSHRVEIRTSEESALGPANRFELLALLGVSEEGNFFGSLSIMAGSEDPSRAIFTVVYRFNSDGSVDIEGRDSMGFSFDKDNDEGGIVECRGSDGSISTYNTESDQACVAPSLTAEQWDAIEQRYREGASHEVIAAEYGLSCG